MISKKQQRDDFRAEILASNARGERATSPYYALAYGYQIGDLVGDDPAPIPPGQSDSGVPPGQIYQGQI
jgi:hypothetical protein